VSTSLPEARALRQLWDQLVCANRSLLTCSSTKLADWKTRFTKSRLFSRTPSPWVESSWGGIKEEEVKGRRHTFHRLPAKAAPLRSSIRKKERFTSVKGVLTGYR
jgi:hypothetical protein